MWEARSMDEWMGNEGKGCGAGLYTSAPEPAVPRPPASQTRVVPTKHKRLPAEYVCGPSSHLHVSLFLILAIP